MPISVAALADLPPVRYYYSFNNPAGAYIAIEALKAINLGFQIREPDGTIISLRAKSSSWGELKDFPAQNEIWILLSRWGNASAGENRSDSRLIGEHGFWTG